MAKDHPKMESRAREWKPNQKKHALQGRYILRAHVKTVRIIPDLTKIKLTAFLMNVLALRS